MFESWKISWGYFKEAWRYVRTHPRIFKIPLLAAGLWLLFILPILLATIIELLWVLKNQSEMGFTILAATLIVDIFLFWLLTYLVIYVYQGMIVAAVYASEIGRKEGLLDNLKGNWGALFKFALLTTLFMGALTAANQALGKASAVVQILGKVAIGLIAKVYQLLTVFTVCAIVIEEMPMARALKRSVSLVRKNLVPALFGIIISDVVGFLAILLIFVEMFGIIGLGALLYPVFGVGALGVAVFLFLILMVVTIFGIALIASLVTNVYYALVYLENLRMEGSPLLPSYGSTQTPLTIDTEAMKMVLGERYSLGNFTDVENGLQNAIDWWERRASRWAKE
ncbi:MAG: hypothetical protein QXJ27_04485 [Thermoplasmata archaeon]